MSVPTLTATERHATPAAGRFFDELPALACLIDSDGRLSRVNGAWLELLGYPVQSLVGKPFSKFFHSQELPLLETGLVHCGPRETWDRFEARFRCADGSYKWLLWQFKTDHEKQLVYAVAFDVSDRKQQEAAAQRRLTAATFQAQIWEPFTKGSSTSETLTVWVDALQRHVEARDVQIWIPAQPNGKPVLKARRGCFTGNRPLANGTGLSGARRPPGLRLPVTARHSRHRRRTAAGSAARNAARATDQGDYSLSRARQRSAAGRDQCFPLDRVRTGGTLSHREGRFRNRAPPGPIWLKRTTSARRSVSMTRSSARQTSAFPASTPRGTCGPGTRRQKRFSAGGRLT